MAPAKKYSGRVNLPVSEKLEIISYAKMHGVVTAAEYFGVERNRVYMIRKREDELKELHEVTKKVGSNRKRKFVNTKVLSVNKKTWEWLKQMEENGEPIKEKQIKEKALSFAHDEGVLNFSASNGWLAAFKRRYGVQSNRTRSKSFAHVDTVYQSNSLLKEKVEENDTSKPLNCEKKNDNCAAKHRWICFRPNRNIFED